MAVHMRFSREIIASVLLIIQFTCCCIHGKYKVPSRLIPGFLHRFLQVKKDLLCIPDIRGKAAFIPDGSGQSLLGKDQFQLMIDFYAHAEPFPKA